MATVWQAVAQADYPPRSGELPLSAWDPGPFLRVLPITLLVVGALLIGALILVWVDRWRKRPTEKGTSAGDQLAHFRKLYEDGEISPEEYARIKGMLGGKLRRELHLPAPPPPSTPPVEPPPTNESDG